MRSKKLKAYLITITLYITVIIALMLSIACSHTKEPIRVITQYELKPITIPSVFLLPCNVTRPPDRSNYLEQDWTGKENILTNYVITLLTDLKLCNEQVATVKKLHDEQVKILTKGVKNEW